MGTLIAIFSLALVIGLIFYVTRSDKATSVGNVHPQVHKIRTADVEALVDEIAKMRQEISRQKMSLEIERIHVRQNLSFATLKQLHHESRLMGDSWHERLALARKTRKVFWSNINGLKAERRHHAKNRNQSKGSKRAYHARFGQQLTSSLDALYELLADLDRQINLMSANLTSYNRQTAMLRDYIGANCGEPGRKWRAGILRRAEQRKQLPPSKRS